MSDTKINTDVLLARFREDTIKQFTPLFVLAALQRRGGASKDEVGGELREKLGVRLAMKRTSFKHLWSQMEKTFGLIELTIGSKKYRLTERGERLLKDTKSEVINPLKKLL